MLVHNNGCGEFVLPSTVESPKGVKGKFSVDKYTYRIDTNSVAPGEGGFHIHVFRDANEIAKISGRGGYSISHRGRTLLRPSEMNPTVKREINKLVNYVRRRIDG